MAAADYDIIIEQGSDFFLGLLLKDAKGIPFDLTGVIGAGQVRQDMTDKTAVADFVVTFSSNRSEGKATISIPSNITSQFSFVTGVYDLEFTYPSGIVKRIMQGNVTLSRAVTQ